MTRKQSVYTLASVYIGTVIGAGFASGQEIFQFFGRYGYKGIIGIIITTALFSLFGALVLNIIYSKKIKNFEQFTKTYFGKTLFDIINLLLIFLLFIIYVVMLSGSGAVVYEHFQIPYIYGIFVMAAITLYVFIFGIEGIAKANKIVVPLLVFVVLWVSVYIIYKNKAIFSNLYTCPLHDTDLSGYQDISKFSIKGLISRGNWLWSAFLYVAFNNISTIVVMSSMGPLIKDKRSAVLGGILGGLVLGILALAILISLLILHTDIIGIEVPMIAIAGNLGGLWKQIYSVVLLIAMFTTAIANGYGCILGISNLVKIDPKPVSFAICIASIPFAKLGFKRLVTLFYPLFGYMGIMFIFAMLFKGDKNGG